MYKRHPSGVPDRFRDRRVLSSPVHSTRHPSVPVLIPKAGGARIHLPPHSPTPYLTPTLGPFVLGTVDPDPGLPPLRIPSSALRRLRSFVDETPTLRIGKLTVFTSLFVDQNKKL